jgi:hypothetical protein
MNKCIHGRLGHSPSNRNQSASDHRRVVRQPLYRHRNKDDSTDHLKVNYLSHINLICTHFTQTAWHIHVCGL